MNLSDTSHFLSDSFDITVNKLSTVYKCNKHCFEEI